MHLITTRHEHGTQVVGAVLYLAHNLGCFFFWIAIDATTFGLKRDPDGSLVFIDAEGSSEGSAAAMQLPTNWLTEYDGGSGLEATVWVQYLYSFYWALTTLTTVGYGDITPANNTEVSFSSASLQVANCPYPCSSRALHPRLPSPTPPLPHTSLPPRLPPRLPAPTPPCSHSPHCPRPTLHHQRVYTIISELIGTLCFGYMISAVANLINSIDPNAIKIQAKVDQVKVYLRAHSPRPRNHTRSKKPRLCPYGLPSSRLPSSLS